jgi:hypothetical protein
MRKVLSASLSFVVFSSALILTGCAGLGSASFPNASINASETPLGTINGSVFGGHAPLVGAHLYVLQVGSTAYGSQATSLLSSTSTSSFATHANVSDPKVPTTGTGTPWYYELTDSTGAFNISGDYACTAGQPVYLYAYGGSPTFPSGSDVFSSPNFTVETKTGTTSYTLLFSTSTTENFYNGEPITLSGYTGAYQFLNGQSTSIVADGNLTTTQFDLIVNQTNGTSTNNALTAGTTYTSTGTVTAAPAFNPEVVNLAMLGVCPSSGNFSTGGTALPSGNTFTPLQYVYMNEIATAATAYAMQGFTLSANNSAIDIGAPAADLTGIENAAVNAGLLYDIQGSSISTTYAGEGHIARTNTPNGNGIVPQATLDSIGNILAACVDSASTYVFSSATGTLSPQCKSLLTYTTNIGIPSTASTTPGTEAQDIAVAAINLARYPAGVTSNVATQTAWVSTLYGLPTGNVPFTPHLTATPNDFSVGISFPASLNANFVNPEGIAIDAAGDVWFDDHGGYIFKMSPTGVIDLSYLSAVTPGYVSIDPSGNAWWGVHTDGNTGYVTEISNTGTLLSGTTGYAANGAAYSNTYSYGTAINSSGDFFVPDNIGTDDAPSYTIYELTSSGANATNSPLSGATSCLGNDQADHISLDSAANGSNLWIASQNGNLICKLTSTGATAPGFPIATATGTPAASTVSPEWIGIDSAGNAWSANQKNNTMNRITAGNSPALTHPAGATLNKPFSANIDGTGNIWVTNRGSNSLVEYNNAGTAITSAVNYEGGTMNDPLNLAIDPSGDLWMTNYNGGLIVEMIGLGSPVLTPLSVAQGSNKLGQKP